MPPIDILQQIPLFGAATMAIVGGVWAAGKAVAWLAKTFFPGLVNAARGIVAGAQVLGAVKDLPDYIERNDHQMAVIGEQIREIHHETQLNSGKSLKDHAVRTEFRMKRVEKHLGIVDEEDVLTPSAR